MAATGLTAHRPTFGTYVSSSFEKEQKIPQEKPGRSAALQPRQRAFDGFSWLVHRASWRARLLENALPLIERELRSTVQVPWWKRPSMWRRGFLGEALALYEFGRNGRDKYLTDYERAVRSRMINGAYSILLDDKLQFARMLSKFAAHTPQLVGILRDGHVSGIDDTGVVSDSLTRTVATLGKVVIKPPTGGGGKGIVILERQENGEPLCNNRPIDNAGLQACALANEGSMVSGFARQHETIASLFPRTTNTVRIVTMHDDDGTPFIATSVQRIGSYESEPTDNWSQGGLSAAVDPETGILGAAATYPANRRALEWHDVHPQTGARIAGVAIPHWHHVTTGVLTIARSLPFLPYIGWDVVVTADSFVVLEGNNFTDVNLLQIHRPLLSDPRVATFFRRHGVLGKRPRL